MPNNSPNWDFFFANIFPLDVKSLFSIVISGSPNENQRGQIAVSSFFNNQFLKKMFCKIVALSTRNRQFNDDQSNGNSANRLSIRLIAAILDETDYHTTTGN